MNDPNTPASPQSSRRDFLATSAGISAAGVATMASIDALWASETGTVDSPLLKPGQTILFQGDSITDTGRNRGDDRPNSQPALGKGYAWLAASQILVDAPDAGYRIFNRGISGNKVYQLAKRWQADCLDLKPDVLSILIGVNDYWHFIEGSYDATVEKYETDYRNLLERTKSAIPQVRLVICEPFLLPCGHVTPKWVTEFAPYQAAARRVADDAGATFVPFQQMFDVAVKVAEPKVWAEDGVHPSPTGAALMAHWWLKAGFPEVARRDAFQVQPGDQLIDGLAAAETHGAEKRQILAGDQLIDGLAAAEVRRQVR